MIFILFILLIISLFIDHTYFIENFNNIYRNDPFKLLKYKKENPFDDIQTNKIYSASIDQIQKQSKIPIYYNVPNIPIIKKKPPLPITRQLPIGNISKFRPNLAPILPEILNTSTPILTKLTPIPTQPIPTQPIPNKENFDINPKYKLYGDDNLDFKRAGIIKDPTNIDQTVNINITNHTNNGINKTIKEIYDELTNDNRLKLQTNLDDLETYDLTDNYNIKERYANSRFDTYSIN